MKMNKYDNMTREEFINSAVRLPGNRKGKYSNLYLFPNELMPNHSFKTTKIIGYDSEKEKYELIGDVGCIRFFNKDCYCINVDSLSINCTMVSLPEFDYTFNIHGFAKDTVLDILDIFVK